MSFMQFVLQIYDIKQMDHCILQLCYMSQAFQAYLSTQKFTGRKDRNSLEGEHHHDGHCHCTIHSVFKQKKN